MFSMFEYLFYASCQTCFTFIAEPLLLSHISALYVCSNWGDVQKLGCIETLGSKGDNFFGLHLHQVVQGTIEPRALRVPN